MNCRSAIPADPVPAAATTATEALDPSAAAPRAQPSPVAAAGGGYADGGVPVRGQVRAADGAPVTGAAVTLISLEGRQSGRSVAQADGSYVVDAPGEGSYVLIASGDGYRPQATTLVVGTAPVSYDVLLSGTSGPAGVVRAADSGAPVAAAVVIVTDMRGEVLSTGQTDTLGAFTVAGPAPGTVTLAVSSPKHRPLALPVDVRAAGVTRIEGALRPGAHVRGTVRGAGVPPGDARVTLVDAAGNAVATTTTGLDGAYAFADLDSGQCTVIATGYPPQAAAVTLSGGDVEDHDIELAHGA